MEANKNICNNNGRANYGMIILKRPDFVLGNYKKIFWKKSKPFLQIKLIYRFGSPQII